MRWVKLVDGTVEYDYTNNYDVLLVEKLKPHLLELAVAYGNDSKSAKNYS